MAFSPSIPCPKPSHKRSKKTAKQRGVISPSVAAKVDARANGRCEWCGWQRGNYDPTDRKMGLQRAHLVRRWNVDVETTEMELAKLCGPSVNSGTCHWKVDFTTQGRAWAEEFRGKLIQVKYLDE